MRSTWNGLGACRNCDPNNPSRCKSNFWTYATKLFPGNANLTTPNVGLKRTMGVRPDYFVVEGRLVGTCQILSTMVGLRWI
jgi:hypothetical protein